MIVKEILENGLSLITESMPHVRSVAVGIWLKRGSRHETPEQTGISHFIEHMVFKGTKNRTAERIAAEVDSIGGYMEPFPAKGYAPLHVKVAARPPPPDPALLGEVGPNPPFDRLAVAQATTLTRA